jgi:AcrR family transcriptional regulator
VANQRGRPRGGSKAATRARLIVGARHCFAERGYDGAKNREIAERAGVTASAIYQHFPAKRDVFVAVFEDFEERIASLYQQALDQTESFAAALAMLIDLSGKLHAEDPSYAQFIVAFNTEVQRHSELNELSMATSRFAPIFDHLARRAKATGEVRLDVDERLLARWGATLVMALATYAQSSDGFHEWEQVAEAVKRLLGDTGG